MDVYENLNEKINVYENSICWKITSPLRLIDKVFDRKISSILRKKLYESKETINDLEKRIRGYENSVCWKITSPLRAIDISLGSVVYKSLKKPNIVQETPQIKIENKEEIIKLINALETVMKYKPKISIIMPVYNTEIWQLKEAINSVICQYYKNWELCIIDDGSTKKEIKKCLKSFNDSRIKIKFMPHKGIVSASNSAYKLTSGDYVSFLDHDDTLTIDALSYVVIAINKENPDIIYSDEDKISFDAKRYEEPNIKTDYAIDNFFSQNYINHLTVYKKSLIKKIMPLSKKYEGSQDYDLILKASEKTNKIFHIKKILYHWRKTETSVSLNINAKPKALINGAKALKNSMKRRGINCDVFLEKNGTFRVKRKIIGKPKVSIIIPFKNKIEMLIRCVDSIIMKSTYNNFEILCIDNKSLVSLVNKVKKYYEKNKKIRFLSYPYAFNYSKINNFAVNKSKGEHIILLNNDTLVITPSWIEELLQHSQRKEVGTVGAKLYFPNDTLQHVGVNITSTGYIDHIFKKMPKNYNGFFNRINIIQNVLAVTGAVTMIKKSLYRKIGGLDENLKIGYNDIDLGFNLYEKGYLNVLNPYCELYHFESVSRGHDTTPKKSLRNMKEFMYLKKKHKALFEKGDPYFNPEMFLTDIK